jgi:hypothetical protein
MELFPSDVLMYTIQNVPAIVISLAVLRVLWRRYVKEQDHNKQTLQATTEVLATLVVTLNALENQNNKNKETITTEILESRRKLEQYFDYANNRLTQRMDAYHDEIRRLQ